MMNTDQIARALHGADTILKGATSAVTADELEQALFELADDRRRDGESNTQPFARLASDRDADVTLIYKALDVLRVAEQQPTTERRTAKARLHGQATALLDDHVRQNQRDGKSVEQCATRLARDRDPSFSRLYQHLRDVQREL